tara:strand:+ start:23514 stop:23984 length:471 start_codon:yes stop_codon:yes gene_type:complete
MIHSKIIEFEEAYPVLSHPEIFNRIKDDLAVIEDLSPGDNELFIGTFDDEILIGVWWLEALSSTTLDVHAQILPQYRKHKHASWLQCLEIIINELPNAHKVQAKIPTCFPSVYQYAKHNGMMDEGLERQSKLINGQYFDQWCVGATVKEMVKHGQG